ncbi:MAG: MAB_1171c family putative transporter [Pseudonocardiaceae bacterium]
MFDEITRRVIIVVVCAALVLRTPSMIRDRQQRPLWLLLVVVAGGSMVIQSWFGVEVNRLTGINQFNNLLQGAWGVLDVAVTLEFVVHLVRAAERSGRRRAGRTAVAIVTVAGMTLLFLLTPVLRRFTSPASLSAFTAYSLLAASYMIVAAGAASWLIFRHLPLVRGRTLYAGLLMLAVGNATEIPFMTIRTLQRLTPYTDAGLLRAALVLDTVRFILLPAGCVTAALDPLRRTVMHCYRRARIYPLWHLLRIATAELTLAPPVARWRDLVVVSDAWERLHLRVVEIRDSIVHLYGTWAWPQLLEQATHYAQATIPPKRRPIIVTACWLEVTRRAARSGAPRLHQVLDEMPSPGLSGSESVTREEITHLIRLHRAMRSRQVRAFASDVGRTVATGPLSDNNVT